MGDGAEIGKDKEKLRSGKRRKEIGEREGREKRKKKISSLFPMVACVIVLGSAIRAFGTRCMMIFFSVGGWL